MGTGEAVSLLINLAIGLYMAAIGFGLFTPGKKGSVKNKKYIDKYRKFFKIGGVSIIVVVTLKALV